MESVEYPPEKHILNDLGIEIDMTGESTASVSMRVTPHLLDARGGVRAGVIATLVDVVGGAIGARVLYPDWLATADMTLQIVRPATGPVIEARGTVLRRGRTTMVIEAFVFDLPDDASPVAWATMTFAVLQQNPDVARAVDVSLSPDGPMVVRSFKLKGGTLDRSVVVAASITTSAGVAHPVSMPVDDYVRNSFGAVQGGIIALIGDVAAAEAVRSARGADVDVVTVDLQIAYLAQGRVGPMLARTRLVTSNSEGGHAVIEVIDEGSDHQLAALVSAELVAL